MARPLWSGSISFGLVNVPVKVHTAVRDHDVHFHQVDKKSGSRTPANLVDLVAALEASLKEAKRPRRRAATKRARKSA